VPKGGYARGFAPADCKRFVAYEHANHTDGTRLRAAFSRWTAYPGCDRGRQPCQCLTLADFLMLGRWLT
jgi:hypothetical protein